MYTRSILLSMRKVGCSVLRIVCSCHKKLCSISYSDFFQVKV